MRPQAFSRARAMFALVSAAMLAHPMPGVAQQQALNAIGAYESRGKGGKRARRSVGTKAFQRAAAKKRNRSH